MKIGAVVISLVLFLTVFGLGAVEASESGVSSGRILSVQQQELKQQITKFVDEFNSAIDRAEYQKVLQPALKALEIGTSIYGKDSPERAQFLAMVGNAYFVQKRYKEAKSFFQDSLDLYRKYFPPESNEVVNATKALAGIYYLNGKYELARSLFNICLIGENKLFGEKSPNSEATRQYLAKIETKLSQPNNPQVKSAVNRGIKAQSSVTPSEGGTDYPETDRVIDTTQMGQEFDSSGCAQVSLRANYRDNVIKCKTLFSENYYWRGRMMNEDALKIFIDEMRAASLKKHENEKKSSEKIEYANFLTPMVLWIIFTVFLILAGIGFYLGSNNRAVFYYNKIDIWLSMVLPLFLGGLSIWGFENKNIFWRGSDEALIYVLSFVSFVLVYIHAYFAGHKRNNIFVTVCIMAGRIIAIFISVLAIFSVLFVLARGKAKDESEGVHLAAKAFWTAATMGFCYTWYKFLESLVAGEQRSQDSGEDSRQDEDTNENNNQQKYNNYQERRNNYEENQANEPFVDDLEAAYKILKVLPSATDDEVKKAYQARCMESHSDRAANMSESIKKFAEEEMKRINNAYDLIKKRRKQ